MAGARNQSIAFGDYEITVGLTKAETSRDIATEYVNEAGEKVTMKGGAPGGARKPAEGVTKAVRVSEGKVIRLPEDELEEIVERSKEAWSVMRVLETIDYRQAPTERIKGSYWIAPAKGSVRALGLLKEGLADSGRVAVVKWVSNSREKLGMIRVRSIPADPAHPFGAQKQALLLSELVFANDFARPDDDVLAINDVELPPEAIAAAQRLVKAFARGRVARGGAEVKVDTATNEAVDARIELVQRLQDEEFARELEASAEQVVDEETATA